MPRIGLEPTHPKAPDPKSGVSANFTTWAQVRIHEFNIFYSFWSRKVFKNCIKLMPFKIFAR